MALRIDLCSVMARDQLRSVVALCVKVASVSLSVFFSVKQAEQWEFGCIRFFSEQPLLEKLTLHPPGMTEESKVTLNLLCQHTLPSTDLLSYSVAD